jgi:hypothetical protein
MLIALNLTPNVALVIGQIVAQIAGLHTGLTASAFRRVDRQSVRSSSPLLWNLFVLAGDVCDQLGTQGSGSPSGKRQTKEMASRKVLCLHFDSPQLS